MVAGVYISREDSRLLRAAWWSQDTHWEGKIGGGRETNSYGSGSAGLIKSCVWGGGGRWRSQLDCVQRAQRAEKMDGRK